MSRQAPNNFRLGFFMILIGVCLILMIPFIAQQFTTQVQWSTGDFVIAGILLTVLGLCIDAVMTLGISKKQKVLFVSLFLLLFVGLWAELAVGIFF